MSLQRARVIKGAYPMDQTAAAASRGEPADQATRVAERQGARIVPGAVLDARVEAARILAAARAEAAFAVAGVTEAAATEAREREVAKLAASFLLLRDAEARRTASDRERLVELAVVLAERLIGEALRVEPARIGELAATAIQEARGARRVRIDASPDDIDALIAVLGEIGQSADVKPDLTLGRGSLVVHTDLGRVDARLAPQLERLAVALRDALGASEASGGAA